MSNLSVLVVGGSVAGPTTAYWLAKAGAKVTIIERFPQMRSSGQNVDIRISGVSVMRNMPGMEEAVRANTLPVMGISLVRENGRPYGTIRPTGNANQQSLISEYEILRGDLARILFNLTKNHKNIEYVFGEQVSSLQQNEQSNGPVTAEFMNGYPATEYDLVIACDGATSRTRAMGLGCGTRDYILSLNSWVVFFSIKKELLNGSQIGEAYSTPGGRFICMGSDSSGITRVAMMGINPRNAHDAAKPFREAKKLGTNALKEYVAQYFHGAGWKCDEIITGMLDADDFYGSEMVQVKPPTLHKGRFVLVGDAGYASGPTGTGTSLALTGAYILAGEIRKHRGNIPAALRGYEEQMRPFVNEMQKIPAFIPGILAPQTAWGLWLRNAIFAFICWSGIPTLLQKFFGASSAHSDDYKVPEYEWED